MKSLLIYFLLIAAVICVGCGGNAAPIQNSSEKNISAEEKNKSKSNTIVVYFSHTKHTAAVAKKIQQATHADIYEIVPEKPYPAEYHPATEVAKKEQEENARPAIKGNLPNLDDYDTIILGFPIWWYSTPMIVNTFLESYDFTGKTIAPFCTSGGSGIEYAVDTIKTLAKGATVTEGLVANDSSKISTWLQKIMK